MAHSIQALGIEGRVMQVAKSQRNDRSAFDETGTTDKEESTTRRLYPSYKSFYKCLHGLYSRQRTGLVVIQL